MIERLPLKLTFTVLGFFISLYSVSAQVSLREISLKEQINNSSLVVEGEVISKKSFWGPEQKLIYTAYTVDVYKVFKGDTVKNIEVLVLGGAIGMNALMVSHSLNLNIGNTGVFTLYDSNFNLKSENNIKQYKAYSAIQGFYKYDFNTNEVINVFSKRKGIGASLYSDITSITKTDYTNVVSLDIQKHINNTGKSSSQPPTGISFTSSPVTAGTMTELVISGSDFGATQGKVGFRDADDGGSVFRDALDSEVTSWSDNEIKVLIPTFAGTGNIRITDSGGSSANSNSSLTVIYATINAVFSISGNDEAFEAQHYNDNGSGGNTWKLQTDFFNGTTQAGARESFTRAVESWRCETDINWIVDDAPTTDTDISTSNHIIRFDSGSELDAGVLGSTSTTFGGRGCPSGIIAYVADYDIVFDNETSWYFGAAGETLDSGEFDFETVALHELGHAHLLGHVNDISNVMNFQIGQESINTVLDANSITAASSVHLRSTTNEVCTGTPSVPLMTDYAGTCGLSVEDNTLENSISLYPNPTKQEFFIKSTFANLDKVVIYDVSGRLISEIDVTNTSGIISVNLRGASKGLYFVNLHSDNSYITKKLVVD